MNEAGVIDAVLTEDSDIFVFGAQCVIRGSTVSSNMRADSQVFSAEALEASDDMGLSRAGLLLFALLCGTALAALGHGERLIEIIELHLIRGEEFESALLAWREALCVELETNSSGRLPRKQKQLARQPNSRPST
ncbi:hypothetical protein HGRIS_014862 [Hohenbuehelia grisea]|uniref:XPG-I domain-containing protein n=1 Tax=Hohenbuehelia grisea TaxID=104357 RepID=A0ABR3IQY8_9AGAR